MSAGASDPAQIVRDLIDWARKQSTSPTAAAVRAWLTARGVAFNLGPAIRDALLQGAAAGSRSADAVLQHLVNVGEGANMPGAKVSVDWSGWTPGNSAAARKVLSEDGRTVTLENLLRDAGAQIGQIQAHRLDEVAAVLADSLEQGRGLGETTTALRGVLNDRNWAQMTAWTETNRASSAAALDSYRAKNVRYVEWFTAMDQRVCPTCEANELEGPIPLGQSFSSGDAHPPAHPRCRCAVLPVLQAPVYSSEDPTPLAVKNSSFTSPRLSKTRVLGDAGKSARALATGNEGDAEKLHDYWTRGKGLAKWLGSAHPWTTLYHHLLKYLQNANEAKRTAAAWYHDATGHWPGERKGHNPLGRG